MAELLVCMASGDLTAVASNMFKCSVGLVWFD